MSLLSHKPGGKSRRIGDAGRASERRVAKKLGAKLVAASGAMHGNKGDFKLPEFHGEAKSTERASISVKYEWLGKISREALERGKEPMLTLSFIYPTGQMIPWGDWVVLRRDTFDDMMERLGGQDGVRP